LGARAKSVIFTRAIINYNFYAKRYKTACRTASGFFNLIYCPKSNNSACRTASGTARNIYAKIDMKTLDDILFSK